MTKQKFNDYFAGTSFWSLEVTLHLTTLRYFGMFTFIPRLYFRAFIAEEFCWNNGKFSYYKVVLSCPFLLLLNWEYDSDYKDMILADAPGLIDKGSRGSNLLKKFPLTYRFLRTNIAIALIHFNIYLHRKISAPGSYIYTPAIFCLATGLMNPLLTLAVSSTREWIWVE